MRHGAYPFFGGGQTMDFNGVTRTRAVGYGTNGAPGFESGSQPTITEISSRKTPFRIESNPQRIACWMNDFNRVADMEPEVRAISIPR